MTLAQENSGSAVLYYDRQQWHGWLNETDHALGESLSSALQQLDGITISAVILPLESLLVRSFRLPLPSPRLVDEAVLSQEIEDATGESSSQWWLTWQAARLDEDVAGLLLGMPASWQSELKQSKLARMAQPVAADAELRLTRWLDERGGRMAVMDADSTGVFFGFWHDGLCLGMRRLNSEGRTNEELCAEMLASLKAMGWSEQDPINGRLPPELQGLLVGEWHGEVVDSNRLPPRWQETLRACKPGEACVLGFRRGHWRASAQALWSGGRVHWRRSVLLACGVAALWLLSHGIQYVYFQHRLAGCQQEILEAFHAALPDEPVIDPLAQLRRKGSSSQAGMHGKRVLAALASLSRVYAEVQWNMKSFRFADGQFEIRGEIDSLDTLNTLQEKLQKTLERQVEIADTELSGGKVAFRMVWS
ncbi:MAG: hypothetical protein D6703_06615 [Zetaproteobacteria bacterium]|nr:MAG: hypothetical protein D6703_06615 [Zetaproteobacteria bacterium]